MMDGHDLWTGYPTRLVRGELEPDERAAFEVHIEHCARCRADLRLAETPVRPADRTAPLPPPSRAPVSAAWLVAAAALVIAFGAAGLYVRERATRIAAEVAAAGALGVAAASERTAASLDSAATASDSLLAFVLGEDVRVAMLAAADGGASALVFWDPPRARLLLAPHDLPPAPPGAVYRLWAMGAEPVAIGGLDDAPDGSVRIFELVPGLVLDRLAVGLGTDSSVVPGDVVLTGRFGPPR